MIGILTHHWVKEGKLEQARLLLNSNGLAQSMAPGFISRKTLYSLKDGTQITSLVLWESSEVYDAWRASPERAQAMAGAGDLWAWTPESDRFQVVD